MKIFKKILMILLLGILSLNLFAANLEDIEKATSGKEFMKIFILNTGYETRYQNWVNEINKMSPEEKTRGDLEAKKLFKNKESGEVFFKSEDGSLLMSSKIENGMITSMSMYDKDGVITKASIGEIIIYYINNKKAMVTKSGDINPQAGRVGMLAKNGVTELYYEDGTKAGETISDDQIIFYHKNGKPFIEYKKGWDKEKIY